MDGPKECHTESYQVRQRRRNIVWNPLFVESKKK